MEVQVVTDVLAKNDAIADTLQRTFAEKGIFVFNLLGSPGAGKTSLLEATLTELSKTYRLAVIEGDLYTDKDADRIERLGVPVISADAVVHGLSSAADAAAGAGHYLYDMVFVFPFAYLVEQTAGVSESVGYAYFQLEPVQVYRCAAHAFCAAHVFKLHVLEFLASVNLIHRAQSGFHHAA